jgi:hypothetical protein
MVETCRPSSVLSVRILNCHVVQLLGHHEFQPTAHEYDNHKIRRMMFVASFGRHVLHRITLLLFFFLRAGRVEGTRM